MGGGREEPTTAVSSRVGGCWVRGLGGSVGLLAGFGGLGGVCAVLWGAGYGCWWCWWLVVDAFGSTGGSRRCGMGRGWFMGVPGWVLGLVGCGGGVGGCLVGAGGDAVVVFAVAGSSGLFEVVDDARGSEAVVSTR